MAAANSVSQFVKPRHITGKRTTKSSVFQTRPSESSTLRGRGDTAVGGAAKIRQEMPMGGQERGHSNKSSRPPLAVPISRQTCEANYRLKVVADINASGSISNCRSSIESSSSRLIQPAPQTNVPLAPRIRSTDNSFVRLPGANATVMPKIGVSNNLKKRPSSRPAGPVFNSRYSTKVASQARSGSFPSIQRTICVSFPQTASSSQMTSENCRNAGPPPAVPIRRNPLTSPSTSRTQATASGLLGTSPNFSTTPSSVHLALNRTSGPTTDTAGCTASSIPPTSKPNAQAAFGRQENNNQQKFVASLQNAGFVAAANSLAKSPEHSSQIPYKAYETDNSDNEMPGTPENNGYHYLSDSLGAQVGHKTLLQSNTESLGEHKFSSVSHPKLTESADRPKPEEGQIEVIVIDSHSDDSSSEVLPAQIPRPKRDTLCFSESEPLTVAPAACVNFGVGLTCNQPENQAKLPDSLSNGTGGELFATDHTGDRNSHIPVRTDVKKKNRKGRNRNPYRKRPNKKLASTRPEYSKKETSQAGATTSSTVVTSGGGRDTSPPIINGLLKNFNIHPDIVIRKIRTGISTDGCEQQVIKSEPGQQVDKRHTGNSSQGLQRYTSPPVAGLTSANSALNNPPEMKPRADPTAQVMLDGKCKEKRTRESAETDSTVNFSCDDVGVKRRKCDEESNKRGCKEERKSNNEHDGGRTARATEVQKSERHGNGGCKRITETLVDFFVKQERRRGEEEADDDKAFFRSLLPAIKQLNAQQKVEFRLGVLNAVKKIHGGISSSSIGGRNENCTPPNCQNSAGKDQTCGNEELQNGELEQRANVRRVSVTSNQSTRNTGTEADNSCYQTQEKSCGLVSGQQVTGEKIFGRKQPLEREEGNKETKWDQGSQGDRWPRTQQSTASKQNCGNYEAERQNLTINFEVGSRANETLPVKKRATMRKKKPAP